jgi:hypothetical protein
VLKQEDSDVAVFCNDCVAKCGGDAVIRRFSVEAEASLNDIEVSTTCSIIQVACRAPGAVLLVFRVCVLRAFIVLASPLSSIILLSL